ncbi:GNAT family N-acetyltransferase [Chelatococcus reniformis]|uniref:N-acetyltransferase domain-containing protein n=1 Tax=Chelatococcus reniformis TaxID=1494448 RepID=A0A916U485_9HYPH|nr:N-acetyltransferase [Chelatococcus reniformis]GGC59737.1 hypothetical protein GCM10010994_18100 [Chelatococcus reniformis]
MSAIRPAAPRDAPAITALLDANSASRGGALFGDWSLGTVSGWIASGDLVLVARNGPQLVGVLFTAAKAKASAPPVAAMLRAWPGDTDGYAYGPICIDAAARGHGVFEALNAELAVRMQGRQGILFINEANEPSLRAHARLGMSRVADFVLGQDRFAVFVTRPDRDR